VVIALEQLRGISSPVATAVAALPAHSAVHIGGRLTGDLPFFSGIFL
jgi:hypothetical protein